MGVLLRVVTVLGFRRLVAAASSLSYVLGLGAPGLAWQQLDHSLEDAIIWTVTPTHGLVVAELVALPALGLVIAHTLLLMRPVRRLVRV